MENRNLRIAVNFLKVVVCLVALFTTFFTVIDLTTFLSVPKAQLVAPQTEGVAVKVSRDLLVNMFLLSVFVLQHSLLASKNVKDFFARQGLQVVFRSFYVVTTSIVLQFLIGNWKSSPEAIIWELNLNHRTIWWFYLSIHSMAWLLIYVGNICTDVTELLGIKQVYYSIVNLPDPNLRKSLQLQRLNSHMRHPSFLGFILIFWFCPVMSIDRLLLASIFSLYMYLAWNTDDNDYSYHKWQYERKHHELERLQRHNY